MKCPYGCGFEGTEDEVDDHIVYVTTMIDDDREHEEAREEAREGE